MDARTLYDKLWDSHTVAVDEDGAALIYVNRHLVNEVTSPQAFEGLRLDERPVWRRDANYCVADHNVPTRARGEGIKDGVSRIQVETLRRNSTLHRLAHFDLNDPRHGIVHVIGPEQGITLPGMTVVCGDSHTTTHGAFAALAFGIGTSDVEHVLATQTLRMRKSLNMLVCANGALRPGVGAKDLALAIIGRVGTAGGTGYAIEYAGSAVEALSMEGRMTLCNMTVEAGARIGLIGVDRKTITYLEGRPFAPKGELWTRAVSQWERLRSDPAARFDRVIEVDASQVMSQVTWGTSPEMVTTIDGTVPDPAAIADPVHREAARAALAYMDLEPHTPMSAIRIDKVFIGSCTNSRIEDLREAAAVVRGRSVAPSVRAALVVPGSGLVKMQAEAEGLDRIFIAAGFEWRDAGCSMCLGMNEDHLAPGERCASTSNRNFEGRQGAGGRSHLMSPALAAAAAIAGSLADPVSLGEARE